MLLYSRRALIEAAKGCISQIGAASVGGLGGLGVASLRGLLEMEHALQRRETVGSQGVGEGGELSAGSMVCSLTASLLLALGRLRRVGSSRR